MARDISSQLEKLIASAVTFEDAMRHERYMHRISTIEFADVLGIYPRLCEARAALREVLNTERAYASRNSETPDPETPEDT